MALAKASGRMGGEMDSVEGMASEFVEPASESAYNMIVSSATFLGFLCTSLVKCYNATLHNNLQCCSNENRKSQRSEAHFFQGGSNIVLSITLVPEIL